MRDGTHPADVMSRHQQARAMRLGTVEVGRKTPRDGKIEIAAEAAARLREATAGALGGAEAADGDARRHRFVLNAAAEGMEDTVQGEATLVSMPCTCAKGAVTGAHEHHFLEAPAFAQLSPGTALTLDLERDGALHLARAVGA